MVNHQVILNLVKVNYTVLYTIVSSFKFQSLLAYKHYMFIAINNWRKYKENHI